MPRKFIEAEVKSVDKQEGTFEVIASSGSPDRMGDTIDPKGWYLKNYKKNPVILWSHMAGGFGVPAVPPVARADKVWVEDEKELKIKGRWADTILAQELKQLVEGGFLNAVSVGFMPLIEDTKGDIEIDTKFYRRAIDDEIVKGVHRGDGEHYSKQELLELSWVNVPALASALVSARKMNLGVLTKAIEEEINSEDNKKDEAYEKPYPNEHSCRLEDPEKYKRFRRKNCEVKHDDKCIDVIYGVTNGEDEKAERQALRYDKKIWTEASAKSHCKGEEGTFEPASEKEASEDKSKEFNERLTEIEKAIGVLKGTKDPEKGASPLDDKKGRMQNIKKKGKKSDAERLLIIFDKFCEIMLRKLRQ